MQFQGFSDIKGFCGTCVVPVTGFAVAVSPMNIGTGECIAKIVPYYHQLTVFEISNR
jgi:hypothetical protein